MTETVQGAARTPGDGTPRGLRLTRLYTRPGVHPYDEVAWERRDVVMMNWRDGSVNFEQRGVEFPADWSLNAVNIVTTKYFRGAVGSSQRESSLRQLIDRVVGAYVRGGMANGYFATAEDAEIFEHELTYMLVHQIFSFNSPVWFNVGTSARQQVSACQPYDARVSTPAGPVPIGELVARGAVGEKVYDADGLTRILAVKHNGRKPVLRFTTTAGHQLDVTADHLVWRVSGASTGRFIPAGELSVGDQLEWCRTYAYGESELQVPEIAEAALAGWLQADGHVEQHAGTDRSPKIEAMTGNPAELAWVTQALDAVFPKVHRHERRVTTDSPRLDCRRTRVSGWALEPFLGKWNLLARGAAMAAPRHLSTAPLPVVAAYLRSLFQAAGYIAQPNRGSARIGFDMISEGLVRDVQALLARFGIFARVGVKHDSRPGQQDLFSLGIENDGDCRMFAAEIGFIDPEKAGALERSFACPGGPARPTEALRIASIEPRGEMDVYDIQTESGEYLSGGLRVHNCFILAVDDTMDSILNWYKEEGLIFKGGSGAGVNLSRIRSSKELLSSGGTASGPVSFMRGADASAGTIKSGGATRRAAKMVILDVDHPDVEDFVQTKAREEQKIRVLRDAGYDMDLGGQDIVSVQYQNANNSVRVNDEFMRAVEDGKAFALRARLDGSVVETVDARGLFRSMSTAAWECADPGIQYDDTINDWHTCPESGRITASNPCFTGATAVLTVDRGPVAFKDLVGQPALVYCRDATGNVRVSTLQEVRRTREDAELVRVEFRSGGFVRCTPDHLFMLPSGEYVPAVKLQPGQALASWGALHTVASVAPDGREDVFDGRVDRWHNFVVVTADAHGAQRGVFVHNCSEYMHLDNSSCNLASLNLLKFLREDDTFDSERFARVVEFVITAMDISICFADFPTAAITEVTRAYRQLGIGYANLGALLMATGHAYDSQGGRSMAAAITSLMTGTAYKRSAELAGVVGTYDGYARNAEAHQRVMRKHAAANDAVRPVDADSGRILRVATQAWADCLAIGETNGWRNSQASLLAPTGTIGLAMDCDTTGVEPDLALVKFKKLVGGGSMQIVNQTIPRALTKLGYPQEQAEAIIEHIAEHGNVIDAPGLRPEHYEVFDCAIGERAIAPMGHVRMMAAVQPFLSGAISKTVNMPETATVAEVEDIYFQGWKLRLKALAIYRDNCKVGQPLTDAKAAGKGVVTVPDRPVRKRLPKNRTGQTVSFSVGGAEGYMTANAYEDDGLGEIFLKMSKQGSTLAGVMDAFSIAISIALQYGVPLETYVSKFINMRFEPAGMTDDPDVRIAQSVMDYIFRRLALDYLPPERRTELGILSAAERAEKVARSYPAPPTAEDPVDLESLAQSAPVEPPAEEPAGPAGSGTLEATSQTAVDAPLCFTCGIKMRPAGSCYVCESCGSTSGCS